VQFPPCCCAQAVVTHEHITSDEKTSSYWGG